MIHFVHLHAEPGGIEVLLPKIAEQMPRHSFQAFVVRPPVEGQANVYQGKEIAVSYGSAKNRIALWKLWRYARKHREDMFHVFNIGPLNLLALRFSGAKKIVYSIHGTLYWNKPWKKFLLQALWKLTLNKKCRIIANSRHSCSRFRKATGYEEEVTVVYNPFSPDYFKPANQKAEGRLKIMYSGRLKEGKNLFLWASLASEIHRQNPDAGFYLYGEGPLKEALQERARNSGMQEDFHFMGHISDIAAAYQSASLLLFLSEYESFGNVAVESILCGTPVLVSDIPSMREIFENYPEFIVPLDENLKNNILSKIACLPELKASALKAREEFRNRFGMKQHIDKLEQIYAQFN